LPVKLLGVVHWESRLSDHIAIRPMLFELAQFSTFVASAVVKISTGLSLMPIIGVMPTIR
jgi:hypothetical protein